MKDKTLLLIDGDELIYKAGFASQRTHYNVLNTEGKKLAGLKTKKDAVEWIGDSEEEYTIEPEVIPGTEDQARMALYAVMNTILADTKPTDYRLYVSGSDNFRIEVATLLPYKGTRTTDGRPFFYDFIRNMLIDEYMAMVINGMEADDALSITQWHHVSNATRWSTIIGSQDKDLKMVPGLHYNPSKRELYEMTPADARLSFYCQLLSGDRTDNIPGIYRIGDKVAYKMLLRLKNQPNKVIYERVFKAYIEAQSNDRIREKMPGTLWGEERIREVGRLLWMLQEKDQVYTPGENYYDCVGLS